MTKISQAERQETVLAQKQFSFANLVELASFGKLRELSFRPGAVFPPGGFREFREHKALRFLSLKESAISEEDFRDICLIPRLRRVNVEGCTIRDSHLEAIPDSTSVTEFWLVGTMITDRGLGFLGRLTDIQVLVLDRTGISDVGLKALVSLEQLRWLSLMGTRVSGEGIMHLASLPRLTNLNVHSTLITQGDEERFFLAQQSTLARENGWSEPVLAAHTSDFGEPEIALTAFWDAMREWEKHCVAQGERERQGGLSREETQEIWNQRRRERWELLQKHCTEKKRVYDGPDNLSYSIISEYEKRHQEIIAWQPKSKSACMLSFALAWAPPIITYTTDTC